MNKIAILETILDASDQLYSTGRKAEANILTHVARRVAQMSEGDWNPDDMATDDGFMGSDHDDGFMGSDYDDDGYGMHGHLRPRQQQLEEQDDMSPEDLEEYFKGLKDHSGSGHAKHRNVNEFSDLLSDAGAEVDG